MLMWLQAEDRPEELAEGGKDSAGADDSDLAASKALLELRMPAAQARQYLSLQKCFVCKAQECDALLETQTASTDQHDCTCRRRPLGCKSFWYRRSRRCRSQK